MNKLIKLVVFLLNIAALCLSAIWTYTTNYDFEPLILLIISVAQLISFFFLTKEKDSDNQEKSTMKNKNIVENTTISSIGGDFHVGDTNT